MKETKQKLREKIMKKELIEYNNLLRKKERALLYYQELAGASWFKKALLLLKNDWLFYLIITFFVTSILYPLISIIPFRIGFPFLLEILVVVYVFSLGLAFMNCTDKELLRRIERKERQIRELNGKIFLIQNERMD